MRLSLPKPLHGWRQFAGEVGIIVIGVLIALGAQQVAENRQGRSRALASVAAVKAELAIDAGVFEERVIQQSCEERRLAEVRAIVIAARSTRRLPRVTGIGRSIARPTLRTAWEEAQHSEVLNRWPQQERIAIGGLYSQQEPSDALTLREAGQWLRLQSMMEMMAGSVSDSDLALLADVIGELTFLSWNNGIDARQLVEYITARGIKPKYDLTLDKPGGTTADVRAQVAKSPMCQPLSVQSADPKTI